MATSLREGPNGVLLVLQFRTHLEPDGVDFFSLKPHMYTCSEGFRFEFAGLYLIAAICNVLVRGEGGRKFKESLAMREICREEEGCTRKKRLKFYRAAE